MEFKGRSVIALMLLVWTATLVGAYANTSQTGPYNKLIGHDPVHAIMETYEGTWGDYFYLILMMVPYIGIALYQGDIHIASIWLVSCLAAYGWLLKNVPQYIFYLAVVFWVMSVLIKLLSPVYRD